MKTIDDLHKLSLTEPIINQCLHLYERNFCSKEEALLTMIQALVEQKNHFMSEATRLQQLSASPPLYVGRDER